MTAKQLRELDNWLFENIKGLASNLSPTQDPAAAMIVLEKCAEKLPVCVFKSAISGKWIADYESPEGHDVGIHGDEADTMPLAICLFAKKLFIK